MQSAPTKLETYTDVHRWSLNAMEDFWAHFGNFSDGNFQIGRYQYNNMIIITGIMHFVFQNASSVGKQLGIEIKIIILVATLVAFPKIDLPST